MAALVIWLVGGTALGLIEMTVVGSRPEVNFSSYSLPVFMLYYWIPSALGGVVVWAGLALSRRTLGRRPNPVTWGTGLFAAAVIFVYAGLSVNGMIKGSPLTPMGIGANVALFAASVAAGLAAGALARKLQGTLSRRPALAVAAAAVLGLVLIYLAWAWGKVDTSPRGMAAAPGDVERPNVILITVDALRADHLPMNGYERQTAPFLSRMAGEGANFSMALSQATITVRSMSSIFTSLYPEMHGMMKSGLRISESIPTLPEVLSQSGYATAGFGGGNPSLFHSAGIVRGYDYYDDCRSIRGLVPQKILQRLGLVERMDFGSARMTPPARIVLDKARSWQKQRRDRPFFLFIHLMDVHAPYLPPGGYADKFGAPIQDGPTDLRLNMKCNKLVLGKSEKFFELVESEQFDRMKELDITSDEISEAELRRLVDLYDGSIAYADSQLERFIEELSSEGTLDQTLVVVTADHGEGFLDHGRLFHSGDLVYDELMRVPLVMRYPKAIPSGTKVDAPVRLIDVMPTVLDLAGIDGGEIAGPGGAEGNEREIEGSASAAGASRGSGEAARAAAVHATGAAPGAWKLDLQGRSLVPLLRGDEAEQALRRKGEVYCEGALVSCVRATGWKYIDSPGHNNLELYDLLNDPHETVNLHAEREDVARDLAARLERYTELVRRYQEAHEGPTPIGVDDETRKRLRALGYVE